MNGACYRRSPKGPDQVNRSLVGRGQKDLLCLAPITTPRLTQLQCVSTACAESVAAINEIRDLAKKSKNRHYISREEGQNSLFCGQIALRESHGGRNHDGCDALRYLVVTTCRNRPLGAINSLIDSWRLASKFSKRPSTAQVGLVVSFRGVRVATSWEPLCAAHGWSFTDSAGQGLVA